MNYDFKAVENKWLKRWADKDLYRTPDADGDKYYVLDMYPYPSGAGLHVGHVEGYTATDIVARFMRMNGKQVLHPMGYDSFGLPAENYAIKTGVHPAITTEESIKTFGEQMSRLGLSYDWSLELASHRKDYYRWTQWLFLYLLKKGLAYQKEAPVNWCPSCQTVLANEQVLNGRCERCDSEVIQKNMRQWFFKITDYADRLLEGLDRIDWPESTKAGQRNWIGKSEGAEIDFAISTNSGQQLPGVTVFTTRADTLFSAAFLVLAPESKYVNEIKQFVENLSEVEEYISQSKLKTELERQQQKEKTGAKLSGIVATNPINGQQIPVYLGDFVLAGYGTGAVFGDVHDERDFEFVKQFNIPAAPSIIPEDPELAEKVKNLEICFTDYGILINSAEFTGMKSVEARTAIVDKLAAAGQAKKVINYRLRDWLVSRQRYWGAPIPTIYSEAAAEAGYGFAPKEKFNVLVLHGLGSTGEGGWRSWLTTELKTMGMQVASPSLPNSSDPSFSEWMSLIEKDYTTWLAEPEKLIIVGHSLGGYTALKLAEKYKVRKVLAIAPAPGLTDTNFPDEPGVQLLKAGGAVDSNAIAKNQVEVMVINSKDDQVIKSEYQAELKQQLGNIAHYIDLEGQGHFFSTLDGRNQFYEILNYINPRNNSEMPGVFLVAPHDLPVELPEDVNFKPTGQSPLIDSQTFHTNVICPIFGTPARREVDTMDTFVDSSWYFFRFPDVHNTEEFATTEKMNTWLPVDLYMGGAEHTVLHLLYARFFTKVLFDDGLINFDEPFQKLRHQGTILASDNRKMSKRWGNVINPDDEINSYGADTVRMYEMFMGPLKDSKPWNTRTEEGVHRFVSRVWRLQSHIAKDVEVKPALDAELHRLIHSVTEDIRELDFNTAISKSMEFVNMLYKDYANEGNKIPQTVWETLLILLAPFAPFITEELWEIAGNAESIHKQSWPQFDQSKLVSDTVVIGVQINGKLRGQIQISPNADQGTAEALVHQDESIERWLTDQTVKKFIYVPGKIVNIVI